MRAEAALRSGDSAAALGLLEEAVAADEKDALAWALLGQVTEQAAASGGAGASRTPFLLAEAAAHYRRAVSLAPGLALGHLGLARAALREGNEEVARGEAAVAAASPRNAEERYEASRIEASALVALARKARDDGRTDAATGLAGQARRAADSMVGLDAARAEGFLLAAEASAAAGDDSAAIDILRRGLGTVAAADELHRRYREIRLAKDGGRALVDEYARLSEASPRDAALAWHFAVAAEEAAASERGARRWEGAEELYRKASSAYERAATLRPEWADPAAERRWIALLGRAWSLHGAGDLRGAGDLFAEAVETHPERKDDPTPYGHSPKRGIDSIAIRMIEANDLEGAEAFLARATRAIPGELEWWSNLGYVRWERGMALEADEQLDAARASYEAALAAHERAREIAPDDPAAWNDCVLLLYYHLKRDDERVERYLRTAIEVGERQLESESLAGDARRPVDEATGNAYQNLGVLLYEKRHDLAAAKDLFEKSLRHYPYSRARVRFFLSKIEKEMASRSTGGG